MMPGWDRPDTGKGVNAPRRAGLGDTIRTRVEALTCVRPEKTGCFASNKARGHPKAQHFHDSVLWDAIQRRKQPMKLVSSERYRASAAERRRHGGSIVTKYLVYGGEFNSFYVYGYGKTQHDRKRNASERAKAVIESGKCADHSYAHLSAR